MRLIVDRCHADSTQVPTRDRQRLEGTEIDAALKFPEWFVEAERKGLT